MGKPSSKERVEIKSNTAFRGIGALLVMVFHFGDLRLSSGQEIVVINLGHNIDAAIDLFFLLSGFIMAYIYAKAFGNGISRRTAVKFYWHRLSRLYPVFMFALLVFLVERAVYVVLLAEHFTPLSGQSPGSFFYTNEAMESTAYALFANIFLLHGVGFTSKLSWNYPSWTVSAEYAAYVVFPLMCILLARSRRFGAPILAVLAVAGFIAIDVVFGAVRNVPGNLGVLHCVPGFALGVALFAFSSSIRDVSDRRLQFMQTGALALVLITYFAFDNQILVIAALAVLIVVTSENRGWVSDALSFSPLQFLGRISYAIYILHVVIANPLYPIFRVVGRTLGIGEAETWWLLTNIGIQIAATLIAATLVHLFIEIPARGYMDRLISARGAAAKGLAAASVPIGAAVPVPTERHGG